MHALIDCDILCYEIGCMQSPDGTPLPWQVVQRLVDGKIYHIQQACEATSWQGYITGKGNFRNEIATIQPYKGNRSGEKPFWHTAILNYLRDERNCIVVEGQEADDQIAIDYDSEEDIICSRDKDLNQVPGWHYSWQAGAQKEKPPYFVNEIQGLRSFYGQCLTGDVADNIPGLYGVGASSTHIKKIQKAQTELEMFQIVKEQYELRFGSYWDMFLYENGTLLWLKRTPNDKWYDRQKKLDGQNTQE